MVVAPPDFSRSIFRIFKIDFYRQSDLRSRRQIEPFDSTVVRRQSVLHAEYTIFRNQIIENFGQIVFGQNYRPNVSIRYEFHAFDAGLLVNQIGDQIFGVFVCHSPKVGS